MYTKDLRANVPVYGQQADLWCGAAVGQMVRNGYPRSTDRLLYSQLVLWNAIQAHNSADPTDLGQEWSSDPHGLTACLQSLANPSGVSWSEVADTDWKHVLFGLLTWINQYNFPSPALINSGDHWVAVVGYVTDIAPASGSAPSLQSITVHDPLPENVGSYTTFSGAQWLSIPWGRPTTYPGTWYNKYVALLQTGGPQGEVTVMAVKRTGDTFLSADEAVQRAARWISALNLQQNQSHALFSHAEVENHQPALVRDESPRSDAEGIPHYYIVPFGLKSEISDKGSSLVRGCVIINAYTGEFEESTTFGQPIRYLSRDDAVKIASVALRAEPNQIKDTDVTLLFQPSRITQHRALPLWQVKVNDQTVYVDQFGKLFKQMGSRRPGN